MYRIWQKSLPFVQLANSPLSFSVEIKHTTLAFDRFESLSINNESAGKTRIRFLNELIANFAVVVVSSLTLSPETTIDYLHTFAQQIVHHQ